MKPVIKDAIMSYVYYIKGTDNKRIFGCYNRLDQEFASIRDVENHHEIWDGPLMVKEGVFRLENGQYTKAMQ